MNRIHVREHRPERSTIDTLMDADFHTRDSALAVRLEGIITPLRNHFTLADCLSIARRRDSASEMPEPEAEHVCDESCELFHCGKHEMDAELDELEFDTDPDGMTDHLA